MIEVDSLNRNDEAKRFIRKSGEGGHLLQSLGILLGRWKNNA
jgi:hypothetical protein